MLEALDIAASGMLAAQAVINTAANNIANANTPGYKAQRVNLFDIMTGGVAVDGISQSTAQPNSSGSNVDLAAEQAKLDKAAVLYNANAMVVKMTDQMYGRLLDIMDDPNRQPDNNADGGQ